MFGTEPKRLAVRHDGNGYLPSHRPSLGAHINKDRLTNRSHSHAPGWTSVWVMRIPLMGNQPRRLVLPIPPSVAALIRRHASRPRSVIAVVFVTLLLVFNIRIIIRRIDKTRQTVTSSIDGLIPRTMNKADTCVFGLNELRSLYEWEIESGNYPTRRRIPAHIGIPKDLMNPSVPPWLTRGTIGVPDGERDNATQGIGPTRTYIAPQAKPPHIQYPPRPIRGSIADLDIIHHYCDFNTNQFVRDCLEVMRVGAGLDNGRRFRRGSIDKWKYIYTEDSKPAATAPTHVTSWDNDPLAPSHPLRKQGTQTLPTNTRTKMSSNAGWCDPERPRIFHIYWSGPFTDKPYLTLMSYLFTQPLGLNSTDIREDCTPQFWVWINPGVQAAVPNGKAYGDMYDDLAANPWSSPFLHKRFHDLIKFKLWNTTAQLDAHDELRGWRQHAWLSKFAVEPDTVLALDDAESLLSAFDESAAEAGVTNAAKEVAKKHGKVEAALIQLQKADAEQVVASDLARFLVTHTHGGAYLDVDNVILRDWEELWGWRGAFAMRWSVHEWYNTAILRMHPGSALGSFLLKSAIASKTTTSAPFHPSAITMYIEDARLAPVLFRIPDAVFDSNFLNMERLQVDRPPYPAYSWESRFEEFFQTPARTGAEANVAGFDAFYRGAFTYHWHNNWEYPVDIGRNFPDLGERFKKTEKIARERHVASLIAQRPKATAATGFVQQDRADRGDPHAPVPTSKGGTASHAKPVDERAPEWEDSATNDERDLSWSAVLKRTFEEYIRGERPNMYGEWLVWE